MTKKEIKDLAKELLVNMNQTPLQMDATMDDEMLNELSAKITARFVQLKELTMWHDRLHMTQVDWDYIDMSEEEEQYEKCAIVKRRLDVANAILKKHEDDEI